MPQFNKKFIGAENISDASIIDTIHYQYNNLGHRCKNIEEIDLNNYILFAGCSHTFGESLNIEDSYPYITSKLLQSDYYNLALPATGLDIMFYNVMMWCMTYQHPKLLIIQYPDYTRFSRTHSFPIVTPCGSWSERSDVLDILIKNETLGINAFKSLCFTNLLNQLNIPKVKLIFGSLKPYDEDFIHVKKLDAAKDNKHYGVETHNMCAELIVEKYHEFNT